MDRMTCSAAAESDLPFIRDTYRENMASLHGVYRTDEEWRKLLSQRDSEYYIVRTEAPAAWFRTETGDGALWLGMLQVHPKFQRRGVGRFILSLTEKMAREKGLRRVGIHTTEDNLAARALYESAGYKVMEIGPCTTADGQERVGYTFEKRLKG